MRRLSDRANADQAPALVTPASAAAAGAGAGAAGGGDPASKAGFDANMVIILAALLFVLICFLGLNSVIRCILHCARRLAPPAGASATTPTTTTTTRITRSAPSVTAGLKKKAMRRIPVEVYGPKSGIPATECAICLGEFADGEKVRVLPRCHHGFHVSCIDMWLATHSSCPTCRDSLLDEGVAGAGTAAAQGR